MCALAILLALLPWYSHHLQTEALRHAELGEQVKSLHVAERTVSVNPLSMQARFVLAGAQQRVGRTVEARRTLVSAVEMQPLNYEGWLQLALYERDRWGESERAREHFAIAISLNPYDDHLQVEAGVKDVEDLE
ncbi:MAG: hypothetical protein C4534_04715 [Gaiellales bacterium]|nr:MAG: hypothetical protein C4534_04715 [Gaiellales bacterium]